MQLFINVGEKSGDILASLVVKKLQQIHPAIQIFGTTGPKLKELGVDSLASIDQLQIMGLKQVVAQIFELKQYEDRLLTAIDRRKPDVALLVDYPGLHFRLAEQLKLRNIKVIQFVAPKLWGWGEHRIASLKKNFDLVLGIFPFETEFFRSRGVHFEYVGNPHLERILQYKQTPSTQASVPRIACLLGSRNSEVQHMAEVFKQIIPLIQEKLPDCRFVFPITDNINIEQLKLEFDGIANLDFISNQALETFAQVDAALITSGTATLEAGLLDCPMVVVYKTDKMSYRYFKKRLKTKWISLVNIVLMEPAVQEHLQQIDPQKVATELVSMVQNKARTNLSAQYGERLRNMLQGDASKVVAEHLLNFQSLPSSQQESPL